MRKTQIFYTDEDKRLLFHFLYPVKQGDLLSKLTLESTKKAPFNVNSHSWQQFDS